MHLEDRAIKARSAAAARMRKYRARLTAGIVRIEINLLPENVGWLVENGFIPQDATRSRYELRKAFIEALIKRGWSIAADL